MKSVEKKTKQMQRQHSRPTAVKTCSCFQGKISTVASLRKESSHVQDEGVHAA